MGKTIKQIADELGVSKQAVQKRIAREPLYTCIQPYISTNKGTKYIDVVGENLVKQAFSEQQPTTVGIDVGIDKPTTVDTLICTLQNELEIKNKQIQELNDRLAETTAALVAAQQTAQTAQALHAGTIQQQLESGEPEAPKEKKRWQFWK